MSEDPEFFGTDEHVTVQKMIHGLWPFLRRHSKLSTNGRNIHEHAADMDELPGNFELVRLIGSAAVIALGSDSVIRVLLLSRERTDPPFDLG